MPKVAAGLRATLGGLGGLDRGVSRKKTTLSAVYVAVSEAGERLHVNVARR